MPTCRPDPEGFTLFELLVVLALLGLIVGLVGPRLGGRLEQAELISRLEQLAGDVRATPLRARLSGRAVAFDPASAGNSIEAAHLPVQSGWTLRYSGPLLVSALGVCQGGTIELLAPSGRRGRVEVAAPYCDTRVFLGADA
ncbi:MAG: prepilin-type N-terminal cleavage/methylation domain-containing protein [Rhodothalassiaceae bacterium]